LQKRKRFTDGEQNSIAVCCPVMLTGVTDLAAHSQLAERAIVLILPEMPDDRRRTEEEADEEFNAAAPVILGALLDGAAAALEGYREAAQAMSRKPRMADFAVWGAAAAPRLGWPSERFLEAYERSRLMRAERVVEADAVARAVYEMAKEEKFEKWSGTATELLRQLDRRAPEVLRRDRKWPKDPTRLSYRLTRVAKALRGVGVTVRQQKSGTRSIDIGKSAPAAP
jgi:hypothetical protein